MKIKTGGLKVNAADHEAYILFEDLPESYAAKVRAGEWDDVFGLQVFAKHRIDTLRDAAKVADCAFDDRPRSRSGHHSEMDWTDGYWEGVKAASAAIRALGGQS